jgi:hypothetical protein
MKKKHSQKAVAVLALLLMKNISAIACEACKKQQPKLLQGVTHGGGPDSNWDYVIVAVMVAVTLYVLVATLKCMFRPAEKDEQHIKRTILNDLQ